MFKKAGVCKILFLDGWEVGGGAAEWFYAAKRIPILATREFSHCIKLLSSSIMQIYKVPVSEAWTNSLVILVLLMSVYMLISQDHSNGTPEVDSYFRKMPYSPFLRCIALFSPWAFLLFSFSVLFFRRFCLHLLTNYPLLLNFPARVYLLYNPPPPPHTGG